MVSSLEDWNLGIMNQSIIKLYFHYRKVWKFNPVSSWILAMECAKIKGIK